MISTATSDDRYIFNSVLNVNIYFMPFGKNSLGYIFCMTNKDFTRIFFSKVNSGGNARLRTGHKKTP